MSWGLCTRLQVSAVLVHKKVAESWLAIPRISTWKNSMRIWGSKWSQYQFFCRLLIQVVLLFACSPIHALFRVRDLRFTLLRNLHRLRRIVVLTLYALAIPTCSHGRTTIIFNFDRDQRLEPRLNILLRSSTLVISSTPNTTLGSSKPETTAAMDSADELFEPIHIYGNRFLYFTLLHKFIEEQRPGDLPAFERKYRKCSSS